MKKVNEANMNISVNGESAAEVSELLRIMQLAGADAKEVGADDINQDDGVCPICGKMHGPSQPMGGCGSKGPEEPSMSDTIKMISKEEEDYDGDFGDATTEPDDEYMRSNAGDVSDMIPSGDDLHKEKGSYPATAGGDNPMNTRESIHAMLTKALAEKQANNMPDNDGDGVPPWADKDDNDPEVGSEEQEKEKEDKAVAEYDVPSNFENKHKDINNLGRKMMDMSSNMKGTDDTSLMMSNALSRLGEVLAEFGGSGFAANNMADVIKKSALNKEIVQMLMKKAKAED
jgi:hypothetical protein